MSFLFTSESVSEGHPDKVCDYIADSILDAYLATDPNSRVACEVLCKDQHVALAGEISSRGTVDHAAVVRRAIREIGYTDPADAFCDETAGIIQWFSKQAEEISVGVDALGAGDQGIMFGYATTETPELMPLPILLAHRLSRTLAEDRKSGKFAWLRPDAKTQVSVLYDEGAPREVTDVVVSTQHRRDVESEMIRDYVTQQLAPRALGAWFRPETRFLVNPTGSFVQGGPSADAGVTGRKIIVDTYGGAAHHGGGAFSGKDPTKVDRSAAYFCRYVARKLLQAGIARRAELQVAYSIGVAQPVSINVDTFATGDDTMALEFVRKFDFRPAAIIERLDLRRPIYRETTNYGHFGRPQLPWEQ